MALFRYYADNYDSGDKEIEKKILIHSLVFAGIFVFLFWVVEIIQQTFGLDFARFGIYPLHLKGLKGILFSPFIHASYEHLMGNSIPFFILLAALVYYYRRISYRIFILVYFISGICVWLGGREAWHIGASGVVYGLAAFHLVSGILRNDIRLLTVSLIVAFLYGGMFWGVFPVKPDISWESHLWGSASGVLLAFYYRKYSVRRKKFDWEDEPDEEDEISEDDEDYFGEPTITPGPEYHPENDD